MHYQQQPSSQAQARAKNHHDCTKQKYTFEKLSAGDNKGYLNLSTYLYSVLNLIKNVFSCFKGFFYCCTSCLGNYVNSLKLYQKYISKRNASLNTIFEFSTINNGEV